jgi:hypothetical protein
MALRAMLPRSLHQVSRKIYVRSGTATAGIRMEPSFIVIGASRCGTTSLFAALNAHPQVFRPTVNKGVNYFDLNYHRGPNWYRGHFPIAGIARSRVSGPVTFEASGYYLFHPFALERLARDMPSTKLVAMLRDPVERAYSAFKHETARGFEWESFERALNIENDRLVGEVERMAQDPTYESFAHRHQTYVHRGQYAEQLERARSLFPDNQIHIIESEAFFREPAREYRRLLDFLELDPFEPEQFDQHNARPSAPMPAALLERLTAHFKPHDDHLAEILGHRPVWKT